MAALTDQRRAELVSYLREDSLAPEDNILLEQMYQSAVAYLAAGGVREPTEASRKASYDLCVNYLVADVWDHRSRTFVGAVAVNPAFRSLLNQLKLSEPVPDSGTGGNGSAHER